MRKAEKAVETEFAKAPQRDEDAMPTRRTDENELLLLRVDAKSVAVVWTKEVGSGEAPRDAPKRSTQKFRQLHNLASPSPVTDGENVVVHFGNGDLAAFDFDGHELWK